MWRSHWGGVLAGAAVWAAARTAAAGMPTVTLSDVARLRLETISFFLLGGLLSAGAVMALWNGLARDFPRLPRLTYGKACGLVTLWGLLFVIVLTMISGARELMTPGAWEKSGSTYRLRGDAAEASSEVSPEALARRAEALAIRQLRLSRLADRLGDFAAAHDGRYPAVLEELKDDSLCELPDLPGTRYRLLAGRQRAGPPLLLAYEPEVYEGQHFVALTDGRIEQWPYAKISRLAEESP